MPSRFGVVLILAFWLAVTGHVLHRDVLPRFATDTPVVQIDLADEATRSVHARWGIWREGKRLGTLQTEFQPVDADDTFKFVSEYQELSVSVLGATVKARKLDLVTTLHRDGRLAGQSMKADVVIDYQGLRVSGLATVNGIVEGDQLVGRCSVKSSFLTFEEPLPPTPVPPGPVLSPLQPMNRLKNVRPGQRWEVREVNPLSDAVAVLLTNALKTHGGVTLNLNGEKATFIAEVQSEPVSIDWKHRPVMCWLIEYRGDRATARTWVAVADGKVLRQEAASFGEVLRLERED